MSLKERVARELDHLPPTELRKVADYVAFLKYRARKRVRSIPNEATLAALYAEFAEEYRNLGEEGLDEYARTLESEDKS